MEDLAERKTITYDMVDMLYLNSTNMGIAEAFTQKTPNPQFKPTCDSLFTNHHNSNLNFNSICITLLSYFQLCKVTRSSSNPDSYCGYANYWLNGKLRKENGKSDKDTSIFFEIFSGSSNKDSGSSECKRYIYNLGDETYKKMNILFTYYNHYSNFLFHRYTKSDLSCTYAKECAKIYKENILNCSNFEDEFCAKLKGFRDKLMQYLESLKICSDTQGIISSIDKTIAESSPQNPGEISSQATTISATSFGTAMETII
ncbi:PIR Superfamily Protein [Plasmodium ovale wallikeri]|uniref:PIR Superfamily Protein n=1 Tax=Plasmodium ovale wallikeri TaxID=864142 RepID=A0A1A9ACY8_PLAOA|nr:PIR Superfamily Protein [Plasmodium ovale wallikeri]